MQWQCLLLLPSALQVVFHDTFKHRTRVPLLTDYYGFTAAALADKGVLYSSPPTSEAPAMLVYRPFDPWAANSEWMVQLPEGEKATAVAAGDWEKGRAPDMPPSDCRGRWSGGPILTLHHLLKALLTVEAALLQSKHSY